MTTEKKIKYGLSEVKIDRGPMTFARLLRSFRITSNLTQSELATKLGISKSNVCDFEKGRKIPSPANAEKIAKKLKEIPHYWIEVALQDMLRENELKYSVHIKALAKAS